MQVSADDFIIDINIPNTDETPVINVLNGFINKYEPEYLKQLLGSTLYSDYKSGLEQNPIPAKWQSLKDNISNEQIASFIYWHFIRKNNNYVSGMNTVVKPKSENSTVADPRQDMVDVWNWMVDESYKSVKFIQDNNTDYGNYYLPSIHHLYYYGFNRCELPDIFCKQNILNI